MRARDWCKLHERWASSKKVRKLTRKYGPAAGGYWALLIARAYTESHHVDNPNGVVRLALQDLADDLYDHHDRTGMFEAMVAANLLVIRGEGWREDLAAEVEVELVGFNDEQWPKGHPSKRSAENRNKQGNSTHGNEVQRNATGCTQIEKRREEIESDAAGLAGGRAHEAPVSLGTSSIMVEQILSMLLEASAPGTHRSVWEDYLDRLLVRRPDLPLQTIAAAADRMLAKTKTPGGSPFAFDRAVTFLNSGIQIESVNAAKFAPASEADVHSSIGALIEAGRQVRPA